MAIGPLGLDLQTDAEAQAAVENLTVQMEMLAKMMEWCQFQEQREHVRQVYLMFKAARRVISEHFELDTTWQ